MVPRPMVVCAAVSGPHTPKISERLDPRLSIVIAFSAGFRVTAYEPNKDILKALSDFLSMVSSDGGGVYD